MISLKNKNILSILIGHKNDNYFIFVYVIIKLSKKKGENCMNFMIAILGFVLFGLGFWIKLRCLNKSMGLGVSLIGLVLFILSQAIVVIPTGYTGVKTTFGQIDEVTIQNGANFKIPFIQSIKEVNNKQQDIEFEGQVWSETSERTAIYYQGITVTYQINPEKSAWIYANISNYKDSLISGNVVESAIKESSKDFTSTDATNRGIIEPAVKENLQKSLDEKYGENVVFINKVTISSADFEEAYNQAIAEKQNAQLIYEKQQIENKKAIEKAEADAKVKETQAQAEANATLIEAQAEADANKLLNDSLTDTILREMYLNKWDGALPKVSLSNDANTMIDLNAINE